MSDVQQALDYVRGNGGRYLNELKEFLVIPSISTLSENKADVQHAAEWVAAQLRSISMDNVKIMPTAVHKSKDLFYCSMN